MKMKQGLSWVMISAMAVFMLVACSQGESANNGEQNQGSISSDKDTSKDENDDKLQVVGDFSILSDIVKPVGGDRVDVYNIIPAGKEPHEWDPSPKDTKKTADADVFFYFGWNLEGLEGDRQNWVYKMLNATGKDRDDDNVFTLSDGIEKKKLGQRKQNDEKVNPHAFISPKNGIKMAKNARDALIKMDPDHKDVYKENAKAYVKKLKDIDQEYEEKIGDIPKEDRILMTSERAFQYVADDYGLKEGFIWEIDSNGEGTPEQIKKALKFVEKNDPNALFDEYNGEKKPMQTVSDETGVRIAGTLYSGDLGTADTYAEYLKHNLQVILNGIAQDTEGD